MTKASKLLNQLMGNKAQGAPVSAANNNWFSITAALGSKPIEIAIYDIIGGYGVSAKAFLEEAKAKGVFDAKAFNLRMHSPGGSVMDGLAIYNTLARLPATIDIYVDGIVASMATVVTCLPNGRVHMPENAWMMIHKPWGGTVGNAADLRESADFLDRNETMMLSIYEKKTGKPREELAAMLTEETWLDGAQAVELGFANVLEAPLQAAAAINQNCMKEFTSMPQALKNLVAPRGNATQPAPDATPATVQATATTLQNATAVLDETAILARLQAAETSRRTEISDLFALAGNRFPDLLAQCHADMAITPAMAKAKIMDAMGKDTQPAGVNTAHIRAGNGNIVGDSVKASVLARAGLSERQADNAYNFMSLRELARASLVDRGVGVGSYNPMEMVGLAFTHSTSDFGTILLDVAHKSMLKGWEESEETFQKWTKRGELGDFKISRRVGMGEFNSLRQVREGAEYKYITLGERGEQIALATYGELFSITRQAIINDDLMALTDIPRKMGNAAKATIGDLVYALLVANPALKTDSKAIFHADHKNLLTGATSALSVDALDAGRTKMRTQKTDGTTGRTLNIRPAYVLTPICLESKANQLIRSASVPGADVNSGIDNPIRNFSEVIGEPRLDDASSTAWYLAASQGSDTIEVAYLNGVDTPYMEQQQGFTSDGVATKVRIDAGVAPLDYRGLVKANGA
jgi:ATP-dependent protease ClpP protease subunit